MKQEFKQQISTYWWNFGSKKKDFTGSVSQFLADKSVKISEVKHPTSKDIKGTRFKMPIGSAVLTFDDFSNYKPDAALTAVKLFLTYLGDRAQIVTGSRTINVNH